MAKTGTRSPKRAAGAARNARRRPAARSAGATRDTGQAVLRECEARLSDLADLSSDWWWEQDAQLRFVELSKAGRSLGGISLADHVGKRWWELPNTEPVNTSWKAHKAVLRARKPFRDLLLRRTDIADGSEHYILVSGKPLFGPDGSFSGYRGLAADVTDRIVAERALQEREEQFRSTFEQAAVGIAHVDLDNRYIRVNRKFCEIVGYGPGELVGKSAAMVSYPEDTGKALVMRQRLLAGEADGFRQEKRYCRKDGSTIWVTRTESLIRGNDGRPVHFIRVIEDITDRKTLETQFQVLFEQAAVGIVRTDFDRNILEVNRKFCEMIGYERDELLQMNMKQISYPADLAMDTVDRGRLLTGEISHFSREKRYVRRDGAVIWARRTVSVARDALGTPEHFIFVIEDVTAQREIEASYRATFESAPVGIMHTTMDRRILHVNSKLCEILGYSREELLQTSLEKLVRPDALGADQPHFMQAMLEGRMHSYVSERPFVRKDGSVIWVTRTVSLVRDTEGKPLYFIRVVQDISKRKQAEEAAARERALLRAVVDALPERIYVKDRKGRFLLQNATNLRVRGIARHEDIVGKTVHDIFPREVAERLEAEDQAVMESGVPLIDREGKTYFGDPGKQGGTVRWHLTSKLPLKDGEGNVFALVGVNRDITERKEAERALRENEELYRNLFERAPVPLLVMQEHSFRLLEVNRAAIDRYGYSREEFLQLTILNLQVEEDRVRVEQELRERDPARSAFFRRRHVTKSGERLYMEVTGRPFLFQGLQARMLLLNDVTERHRAAVALQESEERFRATFEQAGVGMALRDVDPTHPRWLRVNQKLCDILGYTREELLQLTSVELTPPEERRTAIDFNEQLLRGDVTSYSREKRYLRKDGSAVWVNVSLSAVRGVDGRATHIISVIQDVSERKRVEVALRESEELFRQLAGNIPQVFWLSDVSQHRTVYVSPASESMIGRPAQELLSDRRFLVRAVHREDRPRLAAARRLAAHGGYNEIFRIVRPDGSVRWVHDRAFPVRDAEGRIYRLAGIAEDFSVRRQGELALRESEEQFRQLASNIPQVFWITDVAQRQLIYVSPAYEQISGRPVGSLQGDPRAWLDVVHEEDRERVRVARRGALRASYDEIFRVVRPDGTVRWIRDRAFPVRDATGRIYRIAGIAEDITDRRDAEERLMYLAHYDALTSLPNRVLFYDRLKQALAQARRNEWVTAVMFLDLDRFKNVNDTLGHSAGDKLLKQVSERVAACVRSGDTVGRLGGDEFAIVLSNLAGPSDATLVAQKIMSALAEPFQLDRSEVFVTASIGITLFPADSEDQDTLIRNADTAMYRAKELGRNGCQFYTPEMNARALEKLGLENSLRRALERREFQLYYQPKASLATGEITGMEALLRWKHPDLGLVSPADFMPMLEETGLIVATGEWVIRSACAQMRAWQQAGLQPVPVAVNLSARQFQSKDLAQNIARILEEEGIAHGMLELEITESSLVGNTEEAAGTLVFLNSLGIRVAIDDFGTGYSSLSYLKRFPLDALKIDGSFVRDITTDADDAAITRAIITMAHSLELSVVAEGVETEQQLNFLSANGCDEIQGYYFNAPIPAQDVAELLASGRRLRRPKPMEDGSEAAVLLVDDDKDALTLLKRELGHDGYTIYTATSGTEGLDLLGRHDIRVVVSDYLMPGMSGIEFLQKVKSLYPDTVRIMLSGHTDFHTVTEALNKGEIYRFVSKNWNSSHLRANIRQALLVTPRGGQDGRHAGGRSTRSG